MNLVCDNNANNLECANSAEGSRSDSLRTWLECDGCMVVKVNWVNRCYAGGRSDHSEWVSAHTHATRHPLLKVSVSNIFI